MFFLAVFYQNTLKVQRFCKFYYCNRKISSKSIRLHPVFIQTKISKKTDFLSSDKMTNSGNCIHDYDHWFIGNDF